MATHSSILAWRIPWTEEPGKLQSIGSQRVGHDRSDFVHTHACCPSRILVPRARENSRKNLCLLTLKPPGKESWR